MDSQLLPVRAKTSSTILPIASIQPISRTSSPAPLKMPNEVRLRLAQYSSFEDAVNLLKTSSNIIVLTGAGISTSVGILDFRSKTGLYSILNEHGFNDPQDLFHIESFRDDPERFYKIINHILPPLSTPFSPTHAFIKLLQDKGKLLTNYTQNIDDLEREASIDPSRIVQCHGSFATAECMTCSHTYKAKHYLPVVRSNVGAPRCKYCCPVNGDARASLKKKKSPRAKGTKKRKRQEWDDDADDEPPNVGILKPSIVFFGEKVANSFEPRFEKDKIKVDLLLIIGTSLQVAPVKNILLEISPQVPQIFISKERCQWFGVTPDIQLIGKCDVIVEELVKRAGWSLEHQMIKANAAPVRIELEEGTTNRYLVKRDDGLPVNQTKHVKSTKTPSGAG